MSKIEELIERYSCLWTDKIVERSIIEYHNFQTRWRSIADGDLPKEDEVVLLAHVCPLRKEYRCKAGYLTYEDGPNAAPWYCGVGGTNIKYEVTHWQSIDLLGLANNQP